MKRGLNVICQTSASDSSSVTTYLSPPPGYAAICGASAKAKGIVHNLMSYIEMAGNDDTMGLEQFEKWG